MIQVTGVSLIGVDVNFELAGVIGPDQQVFQHHGASGRFNSQLHDVLVLHAEALGVTVIDEDAWLAMIGG